jgi:hypothetical protein
VHLSWIPQLASDHSNRVKIQDGHWRHGDAPEDPLAAGVWFRNAGAVSPVSAGALYSLQIRPS